MAMFEDDSVEFRMKQFNEELLLVKRGKGLPRSLKIKGLYLMHACQKSLYNSWVNIDKSNYILMKDSKLRIEEPQF